MIAALLGWNDVFWLAVGLLALVVGVCVWAFVHYLRHGSPIG